MKNSVLKLVTRDARLKHSYFSALLLVVLGCAGTMGAFADQDGQWWSKDIEQAVSQAGTNQTEIAKALHDVPTAQREGLTFLLQNMPHQDLQTLSASFLLENIAEAYAVMDKVPWGKDISTELFLNNVLPYANINEKREPWRKALYEKCAPLIVNCKTPGEAAQRLNQKLFPLVKVKYSTARRKADQSPSETMESGLASCTGLSILLIDACRSVGIPARMTGTPNWFDNRGNHTWVEIWDQRWHFTGAAEPDPKGLDRGWFQADAAKATRGSKEHAIYAASFKKTPLPFPLVWAPELDYVSAVNVTDLYTPKTDTAQAGKTRLMVKVMDRPSGSRVAATVAVLDSADAGTKFEGTSKDEKFDTNDILSFEVPQERIYNLQVQLGNQKVTRKFQCHAKDHEIVEIYLSGSDSGSAPELNGSDSGSGSDVKPLEAADEAGLRQALTNFFNATPEQQADWKFDHALDSLLQKNEAAVRRAAWDVYKTLPIHEELKKNYDAKEAHFQKYVSPYTVRAVGKKPENGWPLFIAMHGGGGAPKDLNDSQWMEMQHHYRDQAALGGYLYLALRAPNDTWNGFYDVYVYPLVDNLIRQFLLFGDVDPNKVFIMGYSHGGYGVFAIGPKMPDHFAAIHASAGAPTDGETTAKTLRTTPFTYMIGENDHAYGRLDRDRAFDATVQKLRGERTDIYPVTMEYKAGYDHPNLPDRDKIKGMYAAVRNPVPKEISWELTDKVIKNFFWIQDPKPGKKQEIDATCKDNHITVTTTNVVAANVLLDSRLVDFKRPVTIEVNGKTTTSTLQPSLSTLCQTLVERGDPEMAYTSKVVLDLQ